MLIKKEEKQYFSSNIPCKSNKDFDIQGDWFNFEFLNDIKRSVIPNHRLTLKVGVSIMIV